MKPGYNEHLANLAQTAKKYGVAIVHVFATDKDQGGFSYTVGLEQNYNHPEILIACPLRNETAYNLLNQVHDLVKNSPDLSTGITLNTRDDRLLVGMDVVFKSVGPLSADLVASEYTTAANLISLIELGRPARVIQMVMPDGQNKMPWDVGYDSKRMARQPSLFATLS